MRLRLLGVVLLVLAAGCTALVGDEGSRSSTVTPAPVPTQPPPPNETAPSSEPDPGTSSDGWLSRPSELSEHHLAAVERSSYRWVEHYSENWTSGNTTYTITSHRRAVVENETVYLVDASFSEPGQFRQGPAIADFGVRRFGDQTDGYSTYADGDDEYVSRTRSDNRTVQTVREPTGRTTYDTLAIRPIESYLDPHSLDVDVLRLRNQDYLVTSDRPATPLARAVENYSARAIVRSDGFVRSLNVTFDVTPGEHTRTVHYRFSYSDVGVASVDPPAWVREARDESPAG